MTDDAGRFAIQILHGGDVLASWRADHSDFRAGDHVSLELEGDEYADMVVSFRVWTGPTTLALWVEQAPVGSGHDD